MAKDITYFVKKLLNIEFMDDHQLLIDLCTHLKPAIYRCRYNMSLANPLLDDIKRHYHRIFLIVKEALLMLKVKYPWKSAIMRFPTLHYILQQKLKKRRSCITSG